MFATDQHWESFRERPEEELPTDKNEQRVSCHSISVKVGHESLDPVPCKWDSLAGVLEAVGDIQLAGAFAPGAHAVIEPCHAEVLAFAEILEVTQVIHRSTLMGEDSQPIQDVSGAPWWCRELFIVLENRDCELVPHPDSGTD